MSGHLHRDLTGAVVMCWYSPTDGAGVVLEEEVQLAPALAVAGAYEGEEGPDGRDAFAVVAGPDGRDSSADAQLDEYVPWMA